MFLFGKCSRRRGSQIASGLGNITAALALLLMPVSGLAASKADIRFYERQYGTAPYSELVERANTVFERLRSVADRRQSYWPELVVLNESPGGPALALPDGNIVLSLPAIQQFYRGSGAHSLMQGDARLAFVLGHELAHFSEDDFWHSRQVRGLTSGLNSDKKSRDQQLRTTELRADERGFVFAAMAGYDVVGLLQSDFFQRWVSRYDSAGGVHATAAQREQRLRARLEALEADLQLYHFAVQLATFGRCDDALPLLREFRREFPAREVLYNSGLCQLQLALQAMPPAEAASWWLPAAFDTASLLDPADSNGPVVMRNRKLSPTVRRYLNRAAADFQQAAEQDDRYWPATLQLAVVNWLLDKPFEARSAIEAALRLQPRNADVIGMRALILAAAEGEASAAVKQVQALSVNESSGSGSERWSYNLARLVQTTDPAFANAIYERLATSQSLPSAIRAVVCGKVSCGDESPATHAEPPVKTALAAFTLGADLYEEAVSAKPLLSKTIAGSEVAVYKRGNLYSLVLDGIVELRREPAGLSLKTLERRYGSGQLVDLANGQLHRFASWGAVERDGEIVEIQTALK